MASKPVVSLGRQLRDRRARTLFFIAGVAAVLTGAAFVGRGAVDPSLTATVRRGRLQVRIIAGGILKPAQSITYRSPLSGREAEIVSLVSEGTFVNEGDLLVRLDTSDVQRELDRAIQDLRQAQVDLQVAEVERQDAVASVESLTEGTGAVGVDEVRSQLRLMEKKVERLRAEYDSLRPLLEKGFITREELDRTGFELEQADSELTLTRRKAQFTVERGHPRERQRARLQLAQKQAQGENVRARLNEMAARVKQLREALDGCSIYARAPGIVVHEEFLGAGQRRKIRVGDRVTATQGLVTIPEVKRMLVEASVPEAEIHHVRAGQPVLVRLDAFQEMQLRGHVSHVGTLARSSIDRPFEVKRFDLVVELDPTTSADLRPEMTARVDIVVDERPDALVVPVNAIFEQQGGTVCYTVHAFRIETRPVRLGSSDGSFVEIVSGMREGERVALTDISSRARPAETNGSTDGTQKSLQQALRPQPKPLGPQ